MIENKTDYHDRLSIESVKEILRAAIKDEERLTQDFHKGRVQALVWALGMIEEATGEDKGANYPGG